MKITSIFENKKRLSKPVLSFEIFPPKKEEALKNIDETLSRLCELNPDFISITFGAGGSTANNKTVEIARKIKESYGVEPLVHLTCLHYSKAEIAAILDTLADYGIENILALRGDVNPDIPVKNDFKYANELVEFIHDYDRDFCISGGCYPETHLEATSPEEDLKNLKRKVDSGANHLVSQLFFDNKLFYDFCDKARNIGITTPIDAGVMPVTNTAQIERMVSMCGASLPSELKKLLYKYADNKDALLDASLAYTIHQIADLIASDVEGIHIYTMNNPTVAKRICNSIKSLV